MADEKTERLKRYSIRSPLADIPEEPSPKLEKKEIIPSSPSTSDEKQEGLLKFLNKVFPPNSPGELFQKILVARKQIQHDNNPGSALKMLQEIRKMTARLSIKPNGTIDTSEQKKIFDKISLASFSLGNNIMQHFILEYDSDDPSIVKGRPKNKKDLLENFEKYFPLPEELLKIFGISASLSVAKATVKKEGDQSGQTPGMK